MNETPVEGRNVDLIPMNASLATEQYLSWLLDPKVSYNLSYPSSSLTELTKYVQKRVADPNCRFWAIITKVNKRHIGNVKLEPISWEHKHTNFGILIGDKESWGKGFATEATLLAVEHAFYHLNLNKVCLGVRSDNIAAIKTYEKAGFRVEGTLKQQEYFHGRFHDLILMAKFSEKSK